MTIGKGRTFLVEMDLEGLGTYLPVGCSNSDSIQLGLDLVEVTARTGGEWSSSINKGNKTLSASVEGFVTDGEGGTVIAYSDLLTYFLANDDPIPTRIVSDLDGDGDPLHGNFFITSIQRSGEHEGVESFSISIQSTGTPSFTAPTPPEPVPEITPSYDASITIHENTSFLGFEYIDQNIVAITPDP